MHEFNRECDDVVKWIKEKEVVACSEESGRDLEHVEVVPTKNSYWFTVNGFYFQILQKRFADFIRDLMSSTDRIEQVLTMAIALTTDRHTGIISIRVMYDYKSFIRFETHQ